MSHRDDRQGRLAELDHERAEHRRLLYAEMCACHDMVARWHGDEIDRLTFEIGVIERADEGSAAMSATYPTGLYPGCPCYRCDSPTWSDGGAGWMPMRVSLCPTCGDKRCPGATDHRDHRDTRTNS